MTLLEPFKLEQNREDEMTATAKKTTAKKTVKAAPKAAEKETTNGYTENGHAEGAFAFAETARTQYDEFMKSMNFDTEEFSGRAQEMFDASRESFEVAQSRFQEVSAEAVEATRQEVADAVDFANELARAKSVGDAMEIQRDYWTRLMDTRIERMRTMTETMVDATRETMEPVNKSMTTAFGAMPDFKAFFPFTAK